MRSCFTFTAIAIGFAATCISSCSSISNEEKLLGSWEFEKPALNRTIVFEKDKKCYSFSKEDGKIDTLLSGTYLTMNEGKTLLFNDAGPNAQNDSIEIIELNDKTLKIKKTDGDTVVMRRGK